MLKITKIEDYAFQVLSYLAAGNASSLHTAKEIAAKIKLPLPTVSKVLKLLTQTEILTSCQGSKGGYTLKQPAGEISVADILSAFDGPFALTDCCSEAGCPRNCSVSPSWQKLNDRIEHILENIKLTDLAPR